MSLGMQHLQSRVVILTVAVWENTHKSTFRSVLLHFDFFKKFILCCLYLLTKNSSTGNVVYHTLNVNVNGEILKANSRKSVHYSVFCSPSLIYSALDAHLHTASTFVFGYANRIPDFNSQCSKITPGEGNHTILLY